MEIINKSIIEETKKRIRIEKEISSSVELLQSELVNGELEEGIEVNWLESTNEWVVSHEYKVLVDNLASEKEADAVKDEIENLLYK